jgi:hypothetical protein
LDVAATLDGRSVFSYCSIIYHGAIGQIPYHLYGSEKHSYFHITSFSPLVGNISYPMKAERRE